MYKKQIKNSSYDDPDNIYYNVIISHDDRFGNTPTIASYDVNTTEPILDKCNDYYLSIVRFSVPGQLIPIFIFEIQHGQPNPNLSQYSITLRFSGTDFQFFLIYVPDNNITPPTTANPTQDLSTTYYFVYTYQHLLTMINTALLNAFLLLKVAFPLAPQTEAPYFIYNSTTQLFSLITEFSYSLPGAIEIYCNSQVLNKFFEAIEVFFLGYNQINGKDFRFVINNNKNNAYAKPGGTIPIPPANPDFLEFRQEYISAQYWNSFKDLVFTTGTIAINNEYTPSASTTSNTQLLSGLTNSSPILTDFIPILPYSGDTRSTLVYYPSGPYRLVDMTSSEPLRKISIKVFWQDQFNNLYPVYIPHHQSLSVKILFVRKTSINITNKDI